VAHGVSARVITADLADPAAPRRISEELEKERLAIDILVNNAGLGIYGPFWKRDLRKELEVVQVNVVALTELTGLLLPGMISRKRGRILNVASTAAFQPGPWMAVYYATKAYVLSFSEALSNETAGTGVTVTALCPGPTITDFQKKAGIGQTRLFRTRLVQDAPTAAKAGYEGMKRGRRVVVPGIANKIFAQGARLAPRRLVTAMTRRIQETRR
jgi:short-subunit dehydrogenase